MKTMLPKLPKVICAWCLKTMQKGYLIGGFASHSCCETCKGRVLSPEVVENTVAMLNKAGVLR